MRLDAHQHFWNYDPITFDWIDDSMTTIRNDYLPDDLLIHLQKNQLDGCITIQCNHSESETDQLLKYAEQNIFVKGVVGWTDLKADDLEDKLVQISKNPFYKGVRHVVQGEGEGFLLDQKFIEGVRLLKKYNLTYDILVYQNQLKEVLEFVKQCPDQPFVIDHLAKPKIKDGEISAWQKDIQEVAKFDNVHCKISGMVTEANWELWKPEDLYPYIDVVIDAFGVDRVMYGSDWPVCQVAASYDQVIDVVENYTSDFSDEEKSKIFGVNAESFYNIEG